MASFPWTTPTSRTTGIATESITTAAGFVGSEIDNATNLDEYLDLDIAFSCDTAPAENTVLLVYLLFAVDGTNYEDGSTSVQSKGVPMPVAAFNVTTGQRKALTQIPIPPSKFKIAIWNTLDQTAVVTVTAKTYRRGYAA